MIEYFLLAFFAAGPVRPAQAPPAKAVPASTSAAPPVARTTAPVIKDPIDISAERFEVQGRQREARLTGNVKAVRGSTTLRCDRALARYTDSREIEGVECAENVEATDGDRWARGDVADFDNLHGTLVVTGNPQARQGPTTMEGSKVTLFLGRDVTVVENARIATANPAGETVITANRFEVQAQQRRALLAGKVKAVRGSTTLTCDRAIAFYTERQQLKRLECAGNVEAIDGDKWARGQRADFNHVTGTLVVTGTPQARQGSSLLEGTKVTFHSGKDVLVVDDAHVVLEKGVRR